MENLDKIKKDLLERLSGRVYSQYCMKLTQGELKRIIDKNLYKVCADTDTHEIKPELIIHEIKVDKEMIFRRAADEIHSYLKSIESKVGTKGVLVERWSGYEDNYLVYEYESVESYDEFIDRISEELKFKITDYCINKHKEDDRNEEIKKLKARLKELGA